MKIPVLSFFTGGGFLDLGFEEAGFEITWTNEVNSVFADLYEFGMTTWRHAHGKPAAKISDRRTFTLRTRRLIDLDSIQNKDSERLFHNFIHFPTAYIATNARRPERLRRSLRGHF